MPAAFSCFNHPAPILNRILPLILAVALFMENMDSTVIATSLPAIAADIGTSPIALKLALTAYFVALAIFIPVSGWMADRYGAKLVFRIAIAVFVAGSLACAGAGSLTEFVAARFLQGMGGAMMTPVGRLLLVRATPKPDLVRAMAWLTIPALFGPFFGPPLGGFMTTYASWHWIFLINLPIGVVGILLASRFLPDIRAEKPGDIDWRGFVLAGLAAAGVVFGLSVVSLPALPPSVGVATIAAGSIASILYIRHALAAPKPLLDLRLLKNPTFRASITGLTLFRIGSGATPFLLPLLFQLIFGLTPFQSGLITFVGAGGALVMKFLAAPLLRALGFRSALAISVFTGGGLIAAAGLFTPQTPYLGIVAVLLAGGLARSLFFTSANALVFADIDDKAASQATAMTAASQQISIALGVALAGGILEARSALFGEALDATGFTIAFAAASLVTMSAAIPILKMDRATGQTVSGHRLGARRKSA